MGDGGNPFLALSGLELPARLLVAYLDSATAQAQVAEVAPTATYDVSIEESTRGPVIAVDVTDDTADGALATLIYIANEVSIQLDRLQEQVAAPTDSEVTSMPLTIDSTAERDTSSAVRLSVAVLASD